jgi:hypothetical protein
MMDTFAEIYQAKFYCVECDSVVILVSWKDILNSGGVQRCDCSDFEDEEEDDE